jgi:prepilin-type N-terminal cleavage/methylation domain-containing protein
MSSRVRTRAAVNTATSPRVRTQAGYTVIELMVASLLLGIFAIALSSASTVYLGLLADLQQRTDDTRTVNVIRARMIADLKASSEAACSDGQTLLLTLDQDGVTSQVEYTASGGKLLRWYSVPDRTLALANRVTELACTGLGERGLELEVGVGASARPSHLYVHVAAAPEAPPT